MVTVRLSAVVLGASDVGGLARFYSELLDLPVVVDEGDWVVLRDPAGGTGVSIQHEPHHVRPTWPAGRGDQHMMIHLDLGVSDLAAAVARAVELGAELADQQPQEGVRVLLDPSGHPFCLFPLADG